MQFGFGSRLITKLSDISWLTSITPFAYMLFNLFCFAMDTNQLHLRGK
ncbi:unnamed protein product, partial [Hymenolepis diminuta]|uniref:ABC2_membrane domain-containing protein n=1 Tax=Hymenolepis diminuta TaxID=6216 RepID=A0A0R3SLT2_HYMDI